ncbi:hypothetical protein LINGRAHAP2_LOCUS6391 [Linum grandiflorum]
MIVHLLPPTMPPIRHIHSILPKMINMDELDLPSTSSSPSSTNLRTMGQRSQLVETMVT